MLNTHAPPLKQKILPHNNGPFLRRKNFKRISWKDLNSKISIAKREITKTGPFIKNKEITVYQKILPQKTEH